MMLLLLLLLWWMLWPSRLTRLDCWGRARAHCHLRSLSRLRPRAWALAVPGLGGLRSQSVRKSVLEIRHLLLWATKRRVQRRPGRRSWCRLGKHRCGCSRGGLRGQLMMSGNVLVRRSRKE